MKLIVAWSILSLVAGAALIHDLMTEQPIETVRYVGFAADRPAYTPVRSTVSIARQAEPQNAARQEGSSSRNESCTALHIDRWAQFGRETTGRFTVDTADRNNCLAYYTDSGVSWSNQRRFCFSPQEALSEAKRYWFRAQKRSFDLCAQGLAFERYCDTDCGGGTAPAKVATRQQRATTSGESCMSLPTDRWAKFQYTGGGKWEFNSRDCVWFYTDRNAEPTWWCPGNTDTHYVDKFVSLGRRDKQAHVCVKNLKFVGYE